MRGPSCQLALTMNLKSTCAKLKCLRFRSLNLIFGIWPQTDIHTHASRNAVTLVWGSLRLAPINLCQKIFCTLHFCIVPYRRKLANFEVLWLFVKVHFGGVAFVGGTSEQSAKFSLWKLYFPLPYSWKLLRDFNLANWRIFY